MAKSLKVRAEIKSLILQPFCDSVDNYLILGN